MIIGVIGMGVVGKAVYQAFSEKFEVLAYDINGKYNNVDEMCKCSVIFVCVPTPTIRGKQDISSLKSVMEDLKAIKFDGVVCIKCTILPGTCEQLKSSYKLKITHNPEFLTAANPYEDFMNQKSVLISGDVEDIQLIGWVYGSILPKAQLVMLFDTKVTETAKYIHNCFLATKVSFMNDMFEMCQNIGIAYDLTIGAAISQGAIGQTHTKVPGPDGKFGFGLACFPKDVTALLDFAKKNEINLPVLEAAWIVNKTRRDDL